MKLRFANPVKAWYFNVHKCSEHTGYSIVLTDIPQCLPFPTLSVYAENENHKKMF